MYNILNRQMRVFISSTFHDMQEERDTLIKKTFPKLRTTAAQRMITLTPIDLRWGVTDREAKSGMILELCLKEIERCQPFFIGILGSRYGRSLQLEDLKANKMLLEQYKWLIEDIKNGLSITEIEMQFAVFRRQHHANALFFIKRNKVPIDEKIGKLISKITTEGLDLTLQIDERAIPSRKDCYYFAYYDTPNELSEMVEKALTRSFESLFPNNQGDDEWTREKRAQAAYLNELCDIYVPQSQNEFTVFYMNQMHSRYVMITSNEECFYGKSAFVANWMKEKQNENTHNFIFHSIGVGYLEGNQKKILKRLCLEVSSLYGLDFQVDEEEERRKDFSSILTKLLEEIKDGKPLFIILDGLQHLSDYDGSKMLEWIPIIPENVSLIVTVPHHDTTQEVFHRRYDSYQILKSFELNEVRLFVEKYLKKFGKRLSEQQLESILFAFSLAQPPPKGWRDILTLKSLLNELVLLGSYDLLDERIAYYCKDRLSHFYDRMFERMEGDYGLETVGLILCLITYSRAGLSESEIIEISDATIMQWSYIYYAILHLLTLKNGKYYINKITIITAITERYGKNENKVRQLLIFHFSHSSDFRAKEECMFQYYHLRDFQSLYSTLLDTNVFSRMCMNSGFTQLSLYWTTLYNSTNRKRYSISSFASIEMPVAEESAHTLANIGFFAKHVLGDDHSASKILSASKDLYESVFHKDYDLLALVYSDLGMYDKAIVTLEKVLSIAKRFHNKNNRNNTYYPELLVQKARLLLQENKKEAAVTLLEEAITLLEEALDLITPRGRLHSEITIYSHLAACYAIINDNAKSQEYIEKAIDNTKKTMGEKHVFLADHFCFYGFFHKKLKHSIEALNFYQKALDVYLNWYPKSHEKVIKTKRSIQELCLDNNTITQIFKKHCLDSWLTNYPSDEPNKRFKDMLDYFKGIADDLYLIETGWEDGMKEYVYNFRYVHDCYIGKDRFLYGPNSNHIYIYIDSFGMYQSCGKSFEKLKDAQVYFIMQHRKL